MSQFNVFHDFTEQYGLLIVEDKGKYGVVDKDDKIVIQIEYDYIFQFKNGYSILIKDSKYGLLDSTGTIVVPAELDHVDKFPQVFLEKIK